MAEVKSSGLNGEHVQIGKEINMAEEVKANPVEGVDEKQTNRVFTQSDYDKALAVERKAMEDRYKDYETLKNKAIEYEKLQKEAEISKLSEVEKANKKATELEQRLALVEEEKNALKKMTLKLGVLSDSKYQILPDPYRKLIDGEDEESIKASADKMVEEFSEYLKKLGVKSDSGLPPDINNKNTSPKKLEDPIVLAFKKRFGG